MPRFAFLIALLALGISGCSDIFSVTKGAKVVVAVVDAESQQGIPSVSTTLQITSGLVASPQVTQATDAGGETEFQFNDGGLVVATITPPAGYTESSTGVVREFVVNRGETVTIVFLLLKEE